MPSQARLQLSQDDGVEDHTPRLDVDFKGGGCFVVACKPFSVLLPDVVMSFTENIDPNR